MFVALFAVSFRGLSTFFMDDGAYKQYAVYKADPGSYDVLLFGSSHMINSCAPLQMREEYGIKAYNLGNQSNYLPTTYWMMRCALKKANPKLIVLDCYYSGEDAKISENSYSLGVHGSFDEVPLSLTKILAARDLYNDPYVDSLRESGELEETEKRTPLGMLVPFSVYHYKWSSIDGEFFKKTECNDKLGYSASGKVTPINKPELIPGDPVFREMPVGFEYLDKIRQYCEKNDIELLLTYFPFDANEQRQMEGNTMEKYAKEHNINCINFLKTDIVDYETDFADDSHLNKNGAKKITKYMGEYISSHYDL